MATVPANVESAGVSWSPRAILRRLSSGDEIARLVTLIFALVTVLITGMIVQQLWVNSAESRHAFGWSFFVSQEWDPVFNKFGALPFIYGTLVTSALGMLIAVPLGLGAAIFLAELAPRRISDILTFMIDLLAAVPSVIYGLLGVFILVPLMRTEIQPFLKHTLGFLPLFQGAGLRHRLSDGRLGARRDDRAVHHLGVARSAAGRASRAARSVAGAGRDALGSDLEGRGALRAHRHHGFGLSGPGSRPGRNHGGHHGGGQQPAHFGIAAWTGILHRQRAGQ